MNVESVQTVIVGGGQAGLAASHDLSARCLPHVVLEGGDRVGDSWRHRWDSLRLFTPARYDGLPGRPFPGVLTLIPVPKNPHGINVTPDGRYAIASGKLSPTVTIIDEQGLRLRAMSADQAPRRMPTATR